MGTRTRRSLTLSWNDPGERLHYAIHLLAGRGHVAGVHRGVSGLYDAGKNPGRTSREPERYLPGPFVRQDSGGSSCGRTADRTKRLGGGCKTSPGHTVTVRRASRSAPKSGRFPNRAVQKSEAVARVDEVLQPLVTNQERNRFLYTRCVLCVSVVSSSPDSIPHRPGTTRRQGRERCFPHRSCRLWRPGTSSQPGTPCSNHILRVFESLHWPP